MCLPIPALSNSGCPSCRARPSTMLSMVQVKGMMLESRTQRPKVCVPGFQCRVLKSAHSSVQLHKMKPKRLCNQADQPLAAVPSLVISKWPPTTCHRMCQCLWHKRPDLCCLPLQSTASVPRVTVQSAGQHARRAAAASPGHLVGVHPGTLGLRPRQGIQDFLKTIV